MLNEEMIKKARGAKSPDELSKLAEEAGMTLGKEEAQKYFDSLHASGEIPDEELSSAVGGCGSYGPAVNRKCPWCGNGIQMNEIIDITAITPNSWGGESESTFTGPTGVCQKCGRRSVYVNKYQQCYNVTEENGKHVIRPENSDWRFWER